MDVFLLREKGSVLVQHDALNPWNVKVTYGPSAQAVRQAQDRSLFTLLLKWRDDK